MNNMELASLVIYPIPRFRDVSKVHKKKSKPKHKKQHDKIVGTKAKGEENEGKKVTNFVDNLIKTGEKNAPHQVIKDEDDKENDIDRKEKEDDDDGKEENKENVFGTLGDKNDGENDPEENEEREKTKENKKERENDNRSKQKEDDDEGKEKEDDGMDDKESTSKDSWAEEEISPKGERQFTSSKRSKIPHAFDEFSSE